MIVITVKCICDCTRDTHVRDERFERVKHFGTLVRHHRRIDQRRSASRKEHIVPTPKAWRARARRVNIYYNKRTAFYIRVFRTNACGVEISVYEFNECMIWLLTMNGFSGSLFTRSRTIMYVAANPRILIARQKPLNTVHRINITV